MAGLVPVIHVIFTKCSVSKQLAAGLTLPKGFGELRDRVGIGAIIIWQWKVVSEPRSVQII